MKENWKITKLWVLGWKSHAVVTSMNKSFIVGVWKVQQSKDAYNNLNKKFAHFLFLLYFN